MNRYSFLGVMLAFKKWSDNLFSWDDVFIEKENELTCFPYNFIAYLLCEKISLKVFSFFLKMVPKRGDRRKILYQKLFLSEVITNIISLFI